MLVTPAPAAATSPGGDGTAQGRLGGGRGVGVSDSRGDQSAICATGNRQTSAPGRRTAAPGKGAGRSRNVAGNLTQPGWAAIHSSDMLMPWGTKAKGTRRELEEKGASAFIMASRSHMSVFLTVIGTILQ